MYVINGVLPTLNDHDKANRSNRFMGAKLKKTATDLVAWQVINKPKIDKPCKIAYTWRYSGRHDLDNIAFAKKYVNDGLVKAGILPDDSQKWLLGFSDIFIKVNKGNEGVDLQISTP